MSDQEQPKIASAAVVRELFRSMAPEAMLTGAQIEAIIGKPRRGNIGIMLHRMVGNGMLVRKGEKRPYLYGRGRDASWEIPADERATKARERNRLKNIEYRTRVAIKEGRPLPAVKPIAPPPPALARDRATVSTSTYTPAPKAAPAAPPAKPETVEQWQARTGQQPEQLPGIGDRPVAYGRKPSAPVY